MSAPRKDPYVEFHEYKAMVRRHQRASRRRDLVRLAGYGAAAALCGFGIVWLATSPPDLRSIFPATLSASGERRVYYPSCAAAHAAGAAPIYKGQQGYGPGLDADDDGVACEPLPRRRW